MKAKILFSSIAFLFFFAGASFSQCVSIELSVKWEQGFDVFYNDSAICFPELSITYRNNSEISLYFPKISDSRYGLPMLPKGSLLQYPIEEFLNPDYLKRAKLHGNYGNQNYDVIIGGSSFTKGWIVVNDTSNIDIEQEIDMINDDLADIYEYIYRENFSKHIDSIEWTKTYFSLSDITPDEISNKLKDKFVFLRSAEIYTDTYNLVGFKLLKGCFTFYISPYLPAYVYTTPIWDKSQSKYIEVKTALPKVVGEYKLYSGNFNSNKITITF